MKSVDPGDVQGLISIPSYHTILGTLICWSMRGSKLLAAFLLMNAAMLLSTPFVGGHYCVDLLAGFATTVAGILIRRRYCLR
jgi:hypothetical protein